MPSMSVSGIVSGMDWESMIDELITKAAKPAQVQVNKKSNLQNKKSLFEEMKVTMQSLQSSLSPLKLPSTYKAKELDIERIDTNGSYKGVLTASVNADAEVNVYDLKVNRLATAQTNRSKQITNATIASELSGITNGKIYVNMGGQKVGIDVNSTDSLQSLKSRINNTLKTLETPMNVTASVVDNRLILKSDNTGLGQVSNTENINYNGLNGYNRLSTLSATDEDRKSGKFIIRDSKSNLIDKDTYVIANGNEIRWNQYDESQHVKLNESVEAKYTMAEGDVYTVSAKVGEEAELPFDVFDGGTLANGKRLVIKDAEGNTYTYGTDFTLEDGKVKWLEAKTETYEPESYKVSYTKTIETSASTTNKPKDSVAPASYTISYTTDELIPSTAQSITKTTTPSDTYQELSVYWDTMKGLSAAHAESYTKSNTTREYLVFDDPSEVSLSYVNNNGNTIALVYGQDYILRSNPDNANVTLISWRTNSNNPSTLSSSGNPLPNNGNVITLSYKHTYTSNDALSRAFSDGKTDNLEITGEGGLRYTNGKDFTIVNGEIKWSIPSTDDAIPDFSTLDSAYREAYGLKAEDQLPTITLTDGNGIIQTYLDPEDRSLFTMKGSNGKTYEYGKDYVIRVNDNGDGYVFSWAITSDKDGDGLTNIVDANTVVTTYTQHKGLSTLGMQASPKSTDTYSFAFTKTNLAESESVSKGNTKTLSSLLGVDVPASEDGKHEGLTITDGTKSYQEGKHFTIDDKGNINWMRKSPILTEEPTDYSLSYTKTTTLSSSITRSNSTNQNADNAKLLMSDIRNAGIPLHKWTNTDGTYRNYVDGYGKENLSIHVTDGTDTYNYLDDFFLCSSLANDDSDNTLYCAWTKWGWWVGDYVPSTNAAKNAARTPNPGSTYSLQIDYTQNYVAESTDAIKRSTLFSVASGDKSNIAITGSDGTEYIYGVDYTIEDDEDGNPYISWILTDNVSSPDKGTEYTLTYEAFSSLSTDTLTYEGDSTSLTASIFLGGDENTLTYSQVLKDSGSDKTKFNDMFSLTSEDGKTSYTYGTDYTITTNDSDEIVIEWLDEENTTLPNANDVLKLTYTGLTTTLDINKALTTRSATDTIQPRTEDVNIPLYSKFIGAEVTITNGKETYTLGTDFTISNTGTTYIAPDGTMSNEVKINWLNENERYNTSYDDIKNAKSIVIIDGNNTYRSGIDFEIEGYEQTTDADGNIIMSGNAQIAWKEDKQPDSLSENAVVKVSTNSGDKFYELDGYDIMQKPLWFFQDTSKSSSYVVRVKTDGGLAEYPAVRDAGANELKIMPQTNAPKCETLKGRTTITQGIKTFYEGTDYNITDDGTGAAQVTWLSDEEGGFEWYMPDPGFEYTVNYTDEDGNITTFNASRSSSTALRMIDLDGKGNGFTTANGNISVRYGTDERIRFFDPEQIYDGEDGEKAASGNDQLKYLYSFNISRSTQGGAGTVFNFNWLNPVKTLKEGMPDYGEALTVEYEYNENVFTLSDNMGGKLLEALELDRTDAEHYTEAQDAELELDGEIVTRSSNYIGEDYGNELIKGMTIQLKGIGEVSLDVSHNAQKAVESINSFMDTYNDLMQWINTRMTEKEVDKDVKATIDSDDFRMRWGLLHGNSLLRNTKSNMRDIMAQNFTYSFTQRTSSKEVYGTMGYNGLRADSTLRLRIGTKYVDVTISPSDTLQDIVDKISDSSNPALRNIYYDDEGKLLEQPLIKASINDDKLVISSSNNEAVTMSGSSAMNALKMNYTYRGLFQLGLATTATDYGKSGELEFDESKFMEALEDNPDEVQELMLMFANDMDKWVKSMLMSSASGETSGTLTRQIEDLDTQIASIDEYLEKYQDRLDRQEETLRKRYAAAENQFYKMSQQANSIAAILNQLNGYANSNNSSGS